MTRTLTQAEAQRVLEVCGNTTMTPAQVQARYRKVEDKDDWGEYMKYDDGRD